MVTMKFIRPDSVFITNDEGKPNMTAMWDDEGMLWELYEHENQDQKLVDKCATLDEIYADHLM